MNETLFELPEPSELAAPRPGGKPRLVRPNRAQVEMRLAALDDLLPAEHLVRVIWAMVEQLDLSAFYDQVQAVEGEPGRPMTDPAVMFGLWLYATAEGVGSARQLERLCGEHLAYQWLCGGVPVNYHSLADFRVAHEPELDALLTQHVAALMSEGLVSLERTAQDGIRVRASAGSGSFRRRARLEEYQAAAQARVAVLKEPAGPDAPIGSARQQAAQARAARERLARLNQALQELKQVEARKAKSHKPAAEQKEARASSTDPQARIMKLPDGGYQPAYNGQLAVDTASGVIVGVDVINQVDQGQMGPMVEQLQARYGQLPAEHLVDGGFLTFPDLEAVAAKGIAVYGPLPAPGRNSQAPTEPHASDGPGVREWRQRMQTAAAKVVYKLRSQTIEWANAGVRQRGLYQFRVRGLSKAKAVLLWLALIHNLLTSRRLQARPAVVGQ
jgi:transposase